MTPLTRAPQFLRDVTTPRVLTLLYHRINNLASDPQSLAVKPHNFQQHLTVLKDSYRVAQFAELAAPEHSRKAPVNTVIITFDDGYSDNLTEALPLLKQASIPATIFVTSGMVQHQKLFWWDELDYILLGEHNLPPQLQVTLQENYSWDLSEDCQWSTDRRNSFSQWCVLEENTPTVRHEIYRRVSGYLRGANEDERNNILQYLSTWAGVAPLDLKSQSLTKSELKTIGDYDLIEIGSHTVNHLVMSELSVATQRKELEDSKSYLESVHSSPRSMKTRRSQLFKLTKDGRLCCKNISCRTLLFACTADAFQFNCFRIIFFGSLCFVLLAISKSASLVSRWQQLIVLRLGTAWMAVVASFFDCHKFTGELANHVQ